MEKYTYTYIYIWFRVGQPPNGDGCSVLLLVVPPCGLWWWGVWDVDDVWYVYMVWFGMVCNGMEWNGMYGWR